MAKTDDAAPRGPPQAGADLVAALYGELRMLASSHLRRMSPGQTMQPTALVHEAYLKLANAEGWNSRAHFFGAAARAMREIIVDELRRKHAQKRGGDGQRVDLSSNIRPAALLPVEDVLAVDAALSRLEGEHPQAAEVVLLAYFGGLTHEEIGEALGLTVRTVERKWSFARAWLCAALEPA